MGYNARSPNALLSLEGAQTMRGMLNIFPTAQKSACKIIQEEERRGDEYGGQEKEGNIDGCWWIVREVLEGFH